MSFRSGINKKRIYMIKPGEAIRGPVVYWMSRDQRSEDNWALLYARDMAISLRSPLAVVFCLVPQFLNAGIRQYGFMIKGLKEVEKSLASRNIPFILLQGEPRKELPKFIESISAGAVVTDFDPLRIKMQWKKDVSGVLHVPFHEVDAHNIVPCRIASDKREYGAYTLRPKISRLLDEFLVEIPPLRKLPYLWPAGTLRTDWHAVEKRIGTDTTYAGIGQPDPGPAAGSRRVRTFISKKLASYAAERNDPNLDGQSGLSPYLHFGQISAQRVALLTRDSRAPASVRQAFLEELIVRRELSDNFCLHAEDYDSTACFPGWARETLDRHRKDRREHTYSLAEFENSRTHDPLWNAAQAEMVIRGAMPGYLRMYWAKKILEWTDSPEAAMETAIYLNDRYQLDGRDPNGYAGIAWSVGGVHDRAWNERPVFGKIRYMSYNGCRSKFDVDGYVSRTEALRRKADLS